MKHIMHKVYHIVGQIEANSPLLFLKDLWSIVLLSETLENKKNVPNDNAILLYHDNLKLCFTLS